MSGTDLDAGTALFVGGFVAGVFLFAGLVTWFVGGGHRAVTALSLGFVALGCVFGLLGVAAALLLRRSSARQSS
jgi:hypothetical protein